MLNAGGSIRFCFCFFFFLRYLAQEYFWPGLTWVALEQDSAEKLLRELIYFFLFCLFELLMDYVLDYRLVSLC